MTGGHVDRIPPILDGPVSPRASRRVWIRAFLTIAVLVTLTVVWRFEPSGQLFYPRCAFYEATGWKCPGCGATRAAHALVHGQWETAWRQNGLFVACLPVFGGVVLWGSVGRRTGHRRANFVWNARFWWAFTAVAFGFGLVRNVV